ncbi:cytochrome-c peroxidase [Achromobacter sp.]|uniref:cytochrome-c peroxidase n=1 Tax=Achromobacter sp. TaxID=134375 RepID=UPI003C790A67
MAASRLPLLILGVALALAAPLARGHGGPSQTPAAGPSGCHGPAGWDAACLRPHYSGSPESWPAPSIDPGLAWREWEAVPPAASPPLSWTAANPGQQELAADVARPAVVALGQMLFFDTRLSRKGQVSCASCHLPQRAFTDGLALAVGEDKLMGRRRSTPLYAAPFAPRLFWDGRAASLKEQVLGPIHDPREMNHDASGVVARLLAADPYPAQFLLAFGAAAAPQPPVDADRLARALAAYVATLRPEPTRFDEFLEGRAKALDDTELIGMHLFRTQARCMNCHSGPMLTDHRFHNIGLSFYGRRNQDLGRYEATRDPADLGKFRTPSLRNVSRAGPWMHNGLFADLKGLLRMYNAGMGREPAPADPPDPYAPRKSEHIRPLELSADEIDALLAFMRVL